MEKLMSSLVFILLLPSVVAADDYYVSPTGNASWGQCTDISMPCSLATANQNAVAGDTVYLRGGTYTISSTGNLEPTHNGTAVNKITFAAYTGEQPLLDGTRSSERGIIITQDYIVIDGIDVKDTRQSVRISGGNYNEIKNCEIYHTDVGIFTQYAGVNIGSSSSYNWFHNNTVHGFGTGGCLCQWDVVRIGETWDVLTSNYNTIEDNIIYAGGHTLTEDFGSYNVWRNNVLHNEGWKSSGQTIYGTATGGGSTACIDSSADFLVAGVEVGDYITAVRSQSESFAAARVTDVNATTITYTVTRGGLSFSSGEEYAIGPCIVSPDPTGTNPGNGMVGGRGLHITGDYSAGTATHQLIEGNRIGYSSATATHDGCEGIALAARGTIVRHNYIFGADGPGINLKSAFQPYGRDNRIYSNTIYKNGQYVTGTSYNPPPRAVGVYQYAGNADGNDLRNNIIYENGNDYSYNDGYDGIYIGTPSDQTWDSNLCDVNNSNLGCTAGVPTFVNADMSDMTSTTLPDLSLQSGSDGIDRGTYLTQANGAGSGSTTLIVDDANCFQAGSSASTNPMGSPLSNIQADWIAIGTVSDTVKISDINYNTNTITLATPMSWSDNAPVWLYKKSDGEIVLHGSAPDMGAYEFVEETSTCDAPSGICWYVDNSATGTNDGTIWENAWQSFADIDWNIIQPGDIIYISGGTSSKIYPPLSIGESGAQNNPIKIRPGQDEGHSGVVIISGDGKGIDLGIQSYVEIDGEYNGERHIKIEGVTSHGVYGKGATGVKINYIEMTNWNSDNTNDNHGIHLTGCDSGFEIAFNKLYSPGYGSGCDAIKTYCNGSNYGDNSIHDNVIYDLPDDGIFAQSGLDIYNNYIDAKNPDLRAYGHPDGIFNHNGAHHIRIWNNYIANFANDLLFFEGRQSAYSNIKIYNNIWAFTEYHDHAWEGISIAQRDYGSPGVIEDVLIANNLFVDIYGKAIEIKNLDVADGRLEHIDVKNNIFVNSGSVLLFEHSSAASGTYNSNVFDHNILFSGDRGGTGIIWEGFSRDIDWFVASKGWTNYDAMPSFLSYESFPDDESPAVINDFHLQASDNVAINKGLTLSDFSVDYDGISRPQGPAWDIGAYEYIQASTECIHQADNNPCDGCITMQELAAFINLWKQDSADYPMHEMMEAIGLWRAGTGCT